MYEHRGQEVHCRITNLNTQEVSLGLGPVRSSSSSSHGSNGNGSGRAQQMSSWSQSSDPPGLSRFRYFHKANRRLCQARALCNTVCGLARRQAGSACKGMGFGAMMVISLQHTHAPPRGSFIRCSLHTDERHPAPAAIAR
jgi:hypothetical protein